MNGGTGLKQKGGLVADNTDNQIKVILFDFGGVMAEEGFREGLKAIARSNGLDPDWFLEIAAALSYQAGYVTGNTGEGDYWNALRRETGIKGSDQELRRELLNRFVLRPWMVDLVRKLRSAVSNVSILSDQTNWLDELNHRDDFFKEFDHVLNSYHLGKAKSDPTIFADVASRFSVEPREIVFIDDNEAHVQRAQSRGIHAIHFRNRDALFRELAGMGLLL